MSAYVALDGVPILHASIVIPFSGIWEADLVLAEPKDLTGPQVLTLADATYKCAPVRAVNFSGARGTRVVGGSGGWRKIIGPRQYAASVRASVVVGDAAAATALDGKAVDERVSVETDRVLGQQYICAQGPASKRLNLLFGAGWWMDPDGVVQTKARDTSPIAGDYTAMRVTGASGMWEIATEDVAAWTPGRSFRGPTSSGVISRVEHKVSQGKLRTVVLSA